MEITFNLEKFKIYIPAGRVGNLKNSLKWSEIDYSEEDINEIRKQVLEQTINININFETKIESLIKTKFNNSQVKEDRISLMSLLSSAQIKEITLPEYFVKESLIIAKDLLAEVIQKLDDNEDIIKKKENLEKLRLINTK